MSKNRINKHEYLTSQRLETKCVRFVRQWTMHVDFTNTLQIKENSP